MPIIIRAGRIAGDLAGDVVRLEALLRDLKRILAGVGPSAADLAGAPRLHPFTIATTEVWCLEGRVDAHLVRDGPDIRTSDLWAFAPDEGWARTLSRFYRLGPVEGRSLLS